MLGSWSRKTKNATIAATTNPRTTHFRLIRPLTATAGRSPCTSGKRARSSSAAGGRLLRRRIDAERRRARTGDHCMCRAGLLERTQRLLDLGPQGDRRRLQVVDQMLPVAERRATLVHRVAQLTANRLELGFPSAASRGDRPRRRPRRSRGPRAAGSGPRRARPGSPQARSPLRRRPPGRAGAEAARGRRRRSEPRSSGVPRPRRGRDVTPPRRRRCLLRAPPQPARAW